MSKNIRAIVRSLRSIADEIENAKEQNYEKWFKAIERTSSRLRLQMFASKLNSERKDTAEGLDETGPDLGLL